MTYRRFLLLWVILLGFGAGAWAQTPADTCKTPISPNQPPRAFEARDVVTGVVLNSFCQGQRVRFEPNTRRGVDPAVVFYDTTKCNFNPQSKVFTINHRPGVISIYENAPDPIVTGRGTTYVRRYVVYGTPKPIFTVQPCSADSVEVTITAPTGSAPTYNTYSVQVGNGRPTNNVLPGTTALYAAPPGGPNTVTVTGHYDAVTCTENKTVSFTPLPAPRQPTIQRLTVRGANVDFQFAPLQPEYRYQVQAASATAPGGYATVATLPASAGTTFTLAAATVPARYRLRLLDPCQTRRIDLASPPLSTVSLLAFSTTNGRNVLKWTTADSASVSAYEITRDGQRLALVRGGSRYVDTLVSCGTTYKYNLTATLGAATSVSDIVVVRTTSTIAAPAPQLAASFNLRNQVELTATTLRNPGSGVLTYARNGQALANTDARALLDSTLAPGTGACYTVRLLDACGNRSVDSAPACPAILSATADPRGNAVTLSWTELRGPDPTAPARYRLLTLAPDNSNARPPIPIASGTTYLDQAPPPDRQVLRYRLEVSGAGLTAPSYSNIATVARRVAVLIPDVFTPNGDGLNDVLEVKGRYPEQFKFTVIDRNGQEVFRGTSRAQSWDGRVNGNPPVPGAYAWRFETQDETGQRVVQNGSVTILR